jgi:TonB family protein
MKQLIAFLIIIAASSSVPAQDTTYFGSNNKIQKSPAKASYFRVKNVASDSLIKVEDFYLCGASKMIGQYSLIGGKEIKNGQFKNFDDKGQAAIIDTYVNGKLVESYVSEYFTDGNPIYYVVDSMPVFPGGDMALRKFIAENIEYPRYAQINSIQGRVFVRFVITPTGAVDNVSIMRGVDASLDGAAMDIIKQLPNFIPGKLRGEFVNVYMVVPINFMLAGKKHSRKSKK